MAQTPHVRLRLHHFLCLQGFRGKGYSETFEKHGWAIRDKLEQPGAKVEAVMVLDDLCQQCPRAERQARCIDDHKTLQMDESLENLLDIHPGQKLTWNEAKLAIAQNLSLEDFEEICSPCSWKVTGDCRRALTQLKKTYELDGVGPV